MGGQHPPTKEQWASIKDHLALVLAKKTLPVYGPVKTPNPVSDPQFPANPWQPRDLYKPIC